MKTSPITLSITMIVRDAGNSLARCLESVNSIADEIVVIDTGSKDKTVKIAESFGAKMGFFEWCDDFGRARNAALDLATSKWVFSIDADEWLPDESQTRVMSLKQSMAEVWRWKMLSVPYGGIDVDGQIRTIITGPRLFPRVGTRWVYRLHEYATNPKYETAVNEGIHIMHEGYAAEDESKPKRNMKILEAGLRDATDELEACHYTFYVARHPTSYSGWSQEERIQAFERCVVGCTPYLRSEAGDAVTNLYLHLKNYDAIVEVCRKLDKWMSLYTHCALVEALWQMGDSKRAREEYLKLNQRHVSTALTQSSVAERLATLKATLG